MSRTLATMAILRENWSDDRDPLANFGPFVADALQHWPAEEPVDPDGIRACVFERWSLDLPRGVVETLLKRARRQGLVEYREEARGSFVVRGVVAGLEDLESCRAAALREMTELVRALREHAARHGVVWDEAQAEEALLAYLDEFGTDFATQRRRGGPMPEVDATEAVALVHSFVRRAVDDDSVALDHLEHAVKGSMLANVLYFDDLGTLPAGVGRLIVYLDTPIVLRALGLALPQTVDGSRELLRLLRGASVPVRVFVHTIDEVRGVLDGVERELTRSRNPKAKHMSRPGREVLDHAIASGMSASDLVMLNRNAEREVRALGIQIEEALPRDKHIRVEELEAALQEAVRYAKPSARNRDVRSLLAIDRLRRRRTYRRLDDCPAVFVTSNPRLARGSRAFFQPARPDDDDGHIVPHCLYEPELVAQLWIRSPGKQPDLPRRQLIADSVSVLNLPTPFWNRWVAGVERLKERGEISDADVAELIHSLSARAALAEITLGLEERFDDEATLHEVIVSVGPQSHANGDDGEAAPDATATAQQLDGEDTAAALRRLAEEVDVLRRRWDRLKRVAKCASCAVAAVAFLGCAAVPLLVAGVPSLLAILLVAVSLIAATVSIVLVFVPVTRVLPVTAIVFSLLAGDVAVAATIVHARDSSSATSAHVGAQHADSRRAP